MLLGGSEAIVNAREALGEVEAGGPKQGVRAGRRTNSRARQFFDPAFPPSPASLGLIQNVRGVDPSGWKTAVEVSK